MNAKAMIMQQQNILLRRVEARFTYRQPSTELTSTITLQKNILRHRERFIKK